MAPPEAATETTPEVVHAGVEVHVQAGGGDMNNDKAVGPSAPINAETHDVGVGPTEPPEDHHNNNLNDSSALGKRGRPEGGGGGGGGVDVGVGGSLVMGGMDEDQPGGSGGGGGGGNKKRRNAKPFRIHLEPLSSIVGDEAGDVPANDGEGGGAEGGAEGGKNLVDAASAAALAEGPGSALVMASLGERIPVDKPNGRYNKNGVCFHKASNKWRAIVYVNKKQVNLGYFPTREESEAQVNAAREHGLPKGFTNLRALQQPRRSEYAGVNWDKHCKRWLARVYEPSVGGVKGKEHKVGYFDDEKAAAQAVRAHRVSLGLPAVRAKKVKEEMAGAAGPGGAAAQEAAQYAAIAAAAGAAAIAAAAGGGGVTDSRGDGLFAAAQVAATVGGAGALALAGEAMPPPDVVAAGVAQILPSSPPELAAVLAAAAAAAAAPMVVSGEGIGSAEADAAMPAPVASGQASASAVQQVLAEALNESALAVAAEAIGVGVGAGNRTDGLGPQDPPHNVV